MSITARVADRGWRFDSAPVCADCTVQSRCTLASRLPNELEDCAAVVQRHVTVESGSRLFGRDTDFSSLFVICRGSVKTQRETRDGGLVVTGFYLAGDLLGLEALGSRCYPCDAVAISDTEVCRLDFERLLELCSKKPDLQGWIIARIGLTMRQKETDWAWATGLQTHRRVLRFFLGLHERLATHEEGPSGPTLLPMKKQDIAWYLHITPETLSRNLQQLRRDGLLRVDHDRFTLPDLARARALTRL